IPRQQVFKNRWRHALVLSAAACLLIAGVSAGYYWKSRDITRSAGSRPSAALATSAPSEAVKPTGLDVIARLQNQNRELASEVSSLQASLAAQSKTADDLHQQAAASEKERGALAQELETREARIAELEHQISRSQVELASLKTQLDTTQTASDNILATNRMRIQELSDQVAEQVA